MKRPTGFYDKYGKEIHEGDTVTAFDGEGDRALSNYTVKWNEEDEVWFVASELGLGFCLEQAIRDYAIEIVEERTI